jgi:predicted amidohydrolase
MGLVLADGDAQERVLIGEVDAARVESVRAEFPFLLDRRRPR